MSKKKKNSKIDKFFESQIYDKSVPLFLFTAIILIFTFVLGPDFGKTKYSFQLGDIVTKDIKAPNDFFIEDMTATTLNRLKAADAVLTVYDYDMAIKENVVRRVKDAFAGARKLLAETVAESEQLSDIKVLKLPTVDSSKTDIEEPPPVIITKVSLNDIKKSEETDIVESTINIIKKSSKTETVTSSQVVVEKTSKTDNVKSDNVKSPQVDIVKLSEIDTIKSLPSKNDIKPLIKTIFKETIGIEVTDGAFKILFRDDFPVRIEEIIITIVRKIFSDGIVANKEILLFEKNRGIILYTLNSKTEKIVYNLRQFYGTDQAKTMVKIIGQPLLKGFDYNTINLVVDFCQNLLKPNIFQNNKETNLRKEKAEAKVKPVMYKIKTGEMLLREGERVTGEKLLLLRDLRINVAKKDTVTSKTGTAMVVACILMIWHFIHLRILTNKKVLTSKDILFVSCVLIITLFFAKFTDPLSRSLTAEMPFALPISSVLFGIPTAAGSMIVCLFLGFYLTLPFAVVLSMLTAMMFPNSFIVFIYFLCSCLTVAYWMQGCRERNVFIKTGFKLGLFNMMIATALTFYSSEISVTKLISDWLLAFSGGLFAGIVTAGTAPLVELLFGYTTDIKLLELANLDQPMLRKLMIEAPGTYNHSVIVGTMSEAAASAIGANPLLAMVCGYYHDIGKITKPLYFVENQLSCKNRHDKLAPSMSALILTGHIKNGVELAKKNKLGNDITDAIMQHHGTSLIRFFYNKAMQQKGESSVNINDFKYPGPKPQTKEIAIVMLADVVEAASRTLDNPTPSKIQGLVQKLINHVFSDGQLSECDLTLKDLHHIAKSFNTLLSGIYHHRIKYPDGAVAGGKNANKEKNVAGSNSSKNTNKQQSERNKDNDRQNRRESQDNLKRLGI